MIIPVWFYATKHLHAKIYSVPCILVTILYSIPAYIQRNPSDLNNLCGFWCHLLLWHPKPSHLSDFDDVFMFILISWSYRYSVFSVRIRSTSCYNFQSDQWLQLLFLYLITYTSINIYYEMSSLMKYKNQFRTWILLNIY